MKLLNDNDLDQFIIEHFVDTEDPIPWKFAKELYCSIFPSLYKHAGDTLILAQAIVKNFESDKPIDKFIIACAAVLHDIGKIIEPSDTFFDVEKSHAEVGVNFLSNLKVIHSNKSITDYKGKMFDLLNAMNVGNISLALGKRLPKILQIIKIHSDDILGNDIYEQIVMDANKLDLFRKFPNGPDRSKLALDVSKSKMMIWLAKILNTRI